MDYQSLHGQDVSNLSSPSPHRMPTVSAAKALQDLQSPTAKYVSTGLPNLDCSLQNKNLGAGDGNDVVGGISRGQVSEIYGAPGVGKTTFGMQLAVNALKRKQRVIWVDGANPVPGPRLQQMLSAAILPKSNSEPSTSPSEKQPQAENLLSKLTHFTTPSLAHLIALLCHPVPSFPPSETSLIVIDSLSALIANTYPRTIDSTNTPQKPGNKNDPAHWASTRKWAVLQYLISSLQKLATLRNIAIVILDHVVTKMQSGSGAMLIPAISSTAWDAGVSTRIVLFRDWGWDGLQIHFAGVTKALGVQVNGRGGVGRVVAYVIEDTGMKEAQLPERGNVPVMPNLATPSRKRKVREIMDSEDEEEYGWEDDDAEELPEATQNQGSEDILVPGPEDEDEEDEDGEEEEVEGEAEVMGSGAEDEDELAGP